MENVIGALGQLGPIGIALVILLIMWVLNRQTTRGYREEIARINKDHDAELEELRINRARELKELRDEIAGLRQEVKDLREDVARESAARRQAEEVAHQLRMGRDPNGG